MTIVDLTACAQVSIKFTKELELYVSHVKKELSI